SAPDVATAVPEAASAGDALVASPTIPGRGGKSFIASGYSMTGRLANAPSSLTLAPFRCVSPVPRIDWFIPQPPRRGCEKRCGAARRPVRCCPRKCYDPHRLKSRREQHRWLSPSFKG